MLGNSLSRGFTGYLSNCFYLTRQSILPPTTKNQEPTTYPTLHKFSQSNIVLSLTVHQNFDISGIINLYGRSRHKLQNNARAFPQSSP